MYAIRSYYDQCICPDFVAVDGVVFAERTLVDPAVGKDKKILRDHAGAFKRFLRIQIDLRVDDVDTTSSRIRGYLRDHREPVGGVDLPVDHTLGSGCGGVTAQADHLNKKPVITSYSIHYTKLYDHLFTEEEQVYWDGDNKRVAAMARTRLGVLVVEEQPLTDIPRESFTQALLQGISYNFV